ncbi:MAG: hypothetical protein OXE76_03955 [Alphaproteobacteria bacterium]|nr:hypothetical protein [Alphaproteobacteria bacterium]
MPEEMKDRFTIILTDDDKRHISIIRERMAQAYLPGAFEPRFPTSDVVRYALAKAAEAAEGRTDA